jgi:hypothetical protein
LDLINRQSGELEALPDDGAAVESAFRSGTHAFKPNQLVPIKAPDGSLVQVPAAHAQKALELGGTIASEAEWQKADDEARYGGIGGGLAAAGEGFVRGLSVGTSDMAAIEAARAAKGDEAAEAVRKHLAGVKRAHPWISTGTEVGGAVVPTLLSEGAAAPEEAALIGGEKLAGAGLEAGAERAAAEGVEGAGATAEGTGLGADGLGGTPPNVPSKPPLVADPALEAAQAAEAAPTIAPKGHSFVSQALQYTPAGLTSKLGLAAEHAAGQVLGATSARGAIGRIIGAGVRAAASGAVEGPIYGAGDYLSESALGDEDLNGEKFVAALGHGLAYGLLAGGVGGASLHGLGEVGQALLRRASPYIMKSAGEEAFRATGAVLSQSKRAEGFGGIADAGQTFLKHGIIGDTLSAAYDASPENLVPRFEVAIEGLRKDIENIRRVNNLNRPAEVTAQELHDAIDAHISSLRRSVIGKDDAKAVESFRDDLLEHFGALQRDVVAPTEAPERRMWKSLEPNSRATAEAEKRAGGVDAVGKSLLDAGIKPLEPGASYEDFFNEIDKATDAAGAHVGNLATQANVAGRVPAQSVLNAVDSVIDEVRGKAGHEGIVSSLEDAKMSIAERLGIRVDRAGAHDDAVRALRLNIEKTGIEPGTARWREAVSNLEKYNISSQIKKQAASDISFATLRGARQDIDQIAFREAKALDPKLRVEYLRNIRSKLADVELSMIDDAHLGEEYKAAKKQYQRLLIAQESADNARMKRLRGFSPKVKGPEFGPAKLIGDKTISFNALEEQRLLMGKKLYPRGMPDSGHLYPDKSPRTMAMRGIHESLGDLTLKAMDNAAKGTKLEGVSSAIKKKMLEYAQLQIGRDAAEHSLARTATNRKLSLTDYLSHSGGGAAGLVVGLATGHVGAGIIAGHAANWFGRYAHKTIREHGNALAAYSLAKISNLDMIARATKSVDSELDASIASLTGRAKPRARVHRFSGPDDKASPEKKYEDAHQQISPYRDIAEQHVEDALPGMTQHAPKTSSAVVRAVNTGAVYLKSKQPTALNAPSIVDPNPKPRTDDVSAEEFHQVRKAVDDPVGVLRDGIENGKITRAQVDAIKDTKPALLADVQRKLVTELSKPRKEQIPYEKLTSLSLIFGVAADPTLDPAHVQVYQASYPPQKDPLAPDASSGGAMKPSSSPAKLGGTKVFSQSAMTGLDRASMAH